MGTATLSSTFMLTLLLSVGLFFFIRASVKDRTQEVKLVSAQTEASLLTQLQQYLTQRAYRVTAIDAAQSQVTFEGFVRPSVFLAIFLTLLAASGILCLALVLSILLPQLAGTSLLLLLLSPLAGIFYWQRAGRPEQVSLKIEPTANPSAVDQSLVTVKAHRDELASLQRALNLQRCE
jgi:hypothetical protein